MKVTLDKAAIKVAYGVGTQKEIGHREVLECVQIGNGEIVAADGYFLVRREIPTEPKEGEIMLVKAKAILDAQKILKADSLIIETQDGKTATIYTEDKSVGNLTITLTTPLMDAKYPNWDKVLPKTERKAYVALGRKLLVKILKSTDEDDTVFKIKVREPHEPVEIHNGDTTIAVMPMSNPEE
jgi:DNA polymerase III sliding clamp (beta) subunit (PCNA family)